MKKKIATLLVTVAMAGALFAGPALARESYYHHDAHWREIHHPRQVYAYNPVYGPAYSYNRIMPRPAHWQLIDGRWRWVRG
jgi:hypothetical protein